MHVHVLCEGFVVSPWELEGGVTGGPLCLQTWHARLGPPTSEWTHACPAGSPAQKQNINSHGAPKLHPPHIASWIDAACTASGLSPGESRLTVTVVRWWRRCGLRECHDDPSPVTHCRYANNCPACTWSTISSNLCDVWGREVNLIMMMCRAITYQRTDLQFASSWRVWNQSSPHCKQSSSTQREVCVYVWM